MFLVPFGIVQYMPNLFYGALLALFGIEITMDWLIHSYRKVQYRHTPESSVCRMKLLPALIISEYHTFTSKFKEIDTKTSLRMLLRGKTEQMGCCQKCSTPFSCFLLQPTHIISRCTPFAVCSARRQQRPSMSMQVSRAEFILLWMTFVAIIYTDLETGIFAGVVFSVFYFAYSYAKVPTWMNAFHAHSHVHFNYAPRVCAAWCLFLHLATSA